ncbi:ATP-binding protein [Sphingomonas sp. MMS24-J13]|uniref:ATP-binding protein n=1 Tax=Sphingomonas sp. MMS24-J13 TaxID=3238686 RepID=UPI0038516883
MTERVKKPSILTVTMLLAALVFWIDSIAEYDLGASILYLAVLVLVSAAGSGKAVARATQLCVVLTLGAWALVHLRHPTTANILRCLFACIAIGVTGALLVSRKRLEATQRNLKRGTSEAELFANSVPFVLWRSNPQGEIEYLNESWTRVTGLDRWSVLEGQRYNDVVHPDDMALLVETVTAAVANRTVTDLKVRVRQGDGVYRWMQIYDNPVFSPLTGQVERFGGLSDVHDEVVAKEELQQVRQELEMSRAELINFTDSVPQILFRASRQAEVDFYNKRFTEVTGRDLNAVMATQDWIEDFHPDDRPGYLANLWKSFAAGDELRDTFCLRHTDGSYRWMSILGRPVRVAEGSDEICYYGGVSDIHDEVTAHQKVRELNETLEQRVAERTSELMRTEIRYAALFDVSNMTFAEMDFSEADKILDAIKADGVTDLRAYMTARPDELARTLATIRTTRVNEALARLMGYESVAELVANPPAENADDGPEVLLRQLEMYYNGVDHIDGRTVLTGKGGQRIPVYYTVSRLADGLHLSSHVDLSDQERIEAMRRAAQAELARANRVATVGAFSASIAHELNQPIASMLMDAQTGMRLAARAIPDMEALGRILERVDRTAQRVAGIVQRTRDNIVAGRPAPKAIDLCRLATETRDLLKHDLSQLDVELEIVCADAVPMINGDPIDLQQVFVNLVNNAADAMRDQTGARRVTLEIAAEEAAVRVWVTDTGPGIPDAHIERLFEPFFTTKPTGIGMGLQICRSAIEAMGGQLTVSNSAGGGACFAFDLPRASGAPDKGD